jgi:hypothetical protein
MRLTVSPFWQVHYAFWKVVRIIIELIILKKLHPWLNEDAVLNYQECYRYCEDGAFTLRLCALIAFISASTPSGEKLAGNCEGGYALNVSRKLIA